VNALGVLSFDFPPANNVARGQLLQTESASRQAAIRADELARQIRAGILVSMDRLRNGSLQLKKAEEANRLYQTSVVNEKTKLSLGMATVLDVLQLEDRLTAASLGYLGARTSYAIALAQLRFDTGTLVATEAERGTIDLRSLTTVPFVDGTKP
jgi:outer membrane protein TolC